MRSPELSDVKVELHGFDVSASQYPHQGSLPANVHLWTSNVFQDPPEEHLHQFDVVHLRLLVTLVHDNDASAIVRHAKKLLSKSSISMAAALPPLSCGPRATRD